MPRYIVERSFPERLNIPVNDEGAEICRMVVMINEEEGVTWIRSYVSEDGMKCFCAYDAPSPEAIRRSASRDVTDIRPDGTTFCTPNTFPHHGSFVLNGTSVKYGFIGDADRCDKSIAPWFKGPDGTQLLTPNDNSGADVMASNLAHLLSVTVTNPTGSGWYDRYGFENASTP